MSTENMVKFLMPDGTEVSNDPRFDQQKAMEEVMANTPNRGDAGITFDEQKAQTQVEHAASLNSGQPGVGPNAVPDDPTLDLHGPTGSPAQRMQVEDAAKAAEAGASPRSTSVADPEPVDSNAAVEAVRQQAVARAQAAQEALDEAGQEPGDHEVDYSEWSAKQLKAEVANRNVNRAEGDMLELKGLKKKSELAALLDEDDQRVASSTDGPTGDPVTQDDLDGDAEDDDEDDDSTEE